MEIDHTIFLFLILFFSFPGFSQTSEKEFSVLFYNVENLFDWQDDPETSDDEFTPSGDRHWTYKRMNTKLLNLSKVILNSSGWEPPAIAAFCEIENRDMLERLTGTTPLKSVPYGIIHKESPDERGIDVALLYNRDRFFPLSYEYFPLADKDGKTVKTRELLYVSGIYSESDTLHIFVNHWPSRYSGLVETQHLRNLSAMLLKRKTDELLMKNSKRKIVIVGDFNDQPMDESIRKILQAKTPEKQVKETELYNLSEIWLNADTGTLKYRSQWSVFDQIIVSGALLTTNSGLYTKPADAGIVQLPFLLEKDETYGGVKPKRTYTGYSYHGGFSDHFPVLLKLHVRD